MEETLEPPPAGLDPNSTTPELPSPEAVMEEGPREVTVMPPVPLLTPDPLEPEEEELLEVISAELLLPPDPPSALPESPTPSEGSPKAAGDEWRGVKERSSQ